MRKNFNQTNNMVPWGLIIGMFFLSVFGICITFLDLDVFRNKQIIKDWHIMLVLILLAILFSAVLTSVFIKIMAEWLNHQYLKQFTFLPEQQTYEEAKWKFNFGKKRYDQVVLLLHGFTGSTQEFEYLIPYLEKNNIPYIAPNILGFGSANTDILHKIRRQDWYRLCLSYFDYLHTLSDNVSIVGHSMGGVLATFIAERRHVHNLILSGPGIYCAKTDIKYNKMIINPITAFFYLKFIPYFPKPIRPGRGTCSDTLDVERAKTIFQYLAIPIKSLRELFLAQQDLTPYKVNFNRFTIVYGKHDLTVDMEKYFNILDKNNITYTKYCFNNSAHNVFEDYDHEESCQLVADILANKR